MSHSPARAICYADDAVQLETRIEENLRLSEHFYRLRFEAPELARRITPGQFVMVRLGGCDDPLIGRPLALYRVVDRGGQPWGIDVVYLVKGKFTQRLARSTPSQPLQVWGPLGNGFAAADSSEHLVMVAGGVGFTPFPAVAEEALGIRLFGSPSRQASRSPNVTFCFGARSQSYLPLNEGFEKIPGLDLRFCTDDGSYGRHGLVTDLLREVLEESAGPHRILCCGPEPMMAATAQIAAETNTACQVSLETPMACGIGICFTCVAKIRDGQGDWDYQRTCVEGPVFESASVVWD